MLVQLTAVLLAILAFALGALVAANLVFATRIVHEIGFFLGQLYLAVAPLRGGTLVKIHPLIRVRLDGVRKLGANALWTLLNMMGALCCNLGCVSMYFLVVPVC